MSGQQQNRGQSRRWLRDLFVGVTVAVFSISLSLYFRSSKELSYKIDHPSIYTEKSPSGATNDVVSHRIHLWNSGNTHINWIAVRLVLWPAPSPLTKIRVRHLTKPRHEFGMIVEESLGATGYRFRYELLNPGDEDVIYIDLIGPENSLANHPVKLRAYAKAEGLVFHEGEDPKSMKLLWSVFGFSGFTFIFGAITTLFAVKFF